MLHQSEKRLEQVKLVADQEKLALDRAKFELDQSKHVLEHIKLYRDRWDVENTLVNQRLTWLLVSQALLFAAFGSMAVKAAEADVNQTHLHEFLQVLPWFGAGLAVLTCAGIAAACCAQYLVYKRQKQCLVPAARPLTLGVHRWTTYVGWLSGLLVPGVFIAAWMWLHSLEASKSPAVAESPLTVIKGRLPPSAQLWVDAGSASCVARPSGPAAASSALVTCTGTAAASGPASRP